MFDNYYSWFPSSSLGTRNKQVVILSEAKDLDSSVACGSLRMTIVKIPSPL